MNKNEKIIFSLLCGTAVGMVITILFTAETTEPLSEIKKKHKNFKSKSYLWL